MERLPSILMAESKSFQSRILDMMGMKTARTIDMTDIAIKGFLETDSSTS
jgi:hypothetical protein